MKRSERLGIVVLVVLFCMILGSGSSISARGTDYKVSVAPPEDLDWSYGAMWKRTTATRERLCLNGYWRFQPLSDKPAEIPRDGWGYLHVPGYWSTKIWYQVKPYFKVLGSDKGEDLKWRGKSLSEYYAAWFQREVDVSLSWKGKRVFMEINQVNTEAEIYWNGRQVGETHYVTGASIEVTDNIVPGKTNQVTILVKVQPTKEDMIHATTGVEILSKNRHQLSGISGDIFLEAVSGGARIGPCRVETSFEKRQATIKATVTGEDRKGDVILEGLVMEKGKEMAKWRTSFLSLAPGSQEITLTGDMDGLRFWELVDNPALYDLRLRLLSSDGSILDEKLLEGVGFRDFQVRGNQFYLNGFPCRLRPLYFDTVQHPYYISGYAVRDYITNLKRAGHNAIYVWSQFGRSTTTSDITTLLSEADRQGVAVYCSIPGVEFMRQVKDKEEGRKRWQEWEEWTRAVISRYGRHPSVLMYVTNINYGGCQGAAQDPAKMDGIYSTRGNSAYRRRKEHALKSIDYIRSLDPSLPIVHHNGGNIAGDVYSLNNYLGWVPLQEKEEWLSHWSEEGKKPLVMSEYGLPHHMSYNTGRPSPGNSLPSERFMTEYSAMYLGPEAYQLEEDVYVRDTTEQQYQGGEEYSNSYWYYNDKPPRNYMKATNMFAKNVYRSWRTWGISGGMVAWDEEQLIARIVSKPSPVIVKNPAPRAPGFHADYRYFGKTRFSESWDEKFWQHYQDTGLLTAMTAVSRDLLAYIGGKPGRFTAKDHHFFPGTRVRKQIILINDSRRKRTVTLHIKVTLSEKNLPLKKGMNEEKVTLSIGEIRKIPLEFEIPRNLSLNSSSEEGFVHLLMQEEGQDDLEDRFTFQVFKPEQAMLRSRIALFDPAGRSAGVLKKLGFKFTPVKKGDTLSNYDLLIIGSKALGEDKKDELPFLLRDFLSRGGKVLVMEQTGKALFNRFGLRVASPCTRRAFVADKAHPILAGLKDRNLADWNGAGTLVEPYPEHKDEFRWPNGWWNGFQNGRPWKWGNYGSVATTLIERGHIPDLVPLVAAEFDLQYSPLLEWRGPKGRAIFFQFDVSSRTESDPVAERLLARTLQYLDENGFTRDWRPTFYAGDSKGSELLKNMQVRFRDIPDIETIPSTSLLILSGDKDIPSRDKLAAYVKRGGNLFFLPFEEDKDLSWLSPALATKEVNLSRSGEIPDDWFFRGLTLSDLHWRGFLDRTCLTGLPVGSFHDRQGLIARLPSGKGSYLFCQIDPESFDIVKKTYLRHSRKNSYALLARLLANAGAEVESRIWDYRYKGQLLLDGETIYPVGSIYLTELRKQDDPYRHSLW